MTTPKLGLVRVPKACQPTTDTDDVPMMLPMMAIINPGVQSLTNNTDTKELITKIVSIWIQAPYDADILNFTIFDNVTRRVADRGTVVTFTYFNNELFFFMATEAQADRVFQRTNNVWILESQVFVRCRGPT